MSSNNTTGAILSTPRARKSNKPPPLPPPPQQRWTTAVMGMYLMTCAGTIYLYGDYSADLKTRANTLGYNYDQSKTNLIGTAMQAGAWFGVIGGLVYDHYGPLVTALGGGLLTASGYALLYMIFSNYFRVSYVGVAAMGFLMGQGSSWLYAAALNTTIFNFQPSDRGKMAGLLVCFFGLSTAIFVQPYSAFFQPNVEQLFAFIACVQLAVGALMGSIFTRRRSAAAPPAALSTTDTQYVYYLYALSILLALYLTVASITEEVAKSRATKIGFCIGGIVVFASATFVPLHAKHRGHDDDVLVGDGDDDEAVRLVTAASTPISSSSSSTLSSSSSPSSRRYPSVEMNSLQMLRTLNFWLLFCSFCVVIGSGVMFIANLDSITYAASGTTGMKSTLATLMSVCNALGRMLFGYASDKYITVWSREHFYTLACALMSLVHAYMLIFASIKSMLYLGVVMCGLVYGGTFCLLPIITSEQFGMVNFGANFGVIGLAPALGSYVISTILAGHFYDSHAHTLDTTTHKLRCVGEACFHTTFLITTFLCLFGTICAGLLTILTLRQRRIVQLPSATSAAAAAGGGGA